MCTSINFHFTPNSRIIIHEAVPQFFLSSLLHFISFNNRVAQMEHLKLDSSIQISFEDISKFN